MGKLSPKVSEVYAVRHAQNQRRNREKTLQAKPEHISLRKRYYLTLEFLLVICKMIVKTIVQNAKALKNTFPLRSLSLVRLGGSKLKGEYINILIGCIMKHLGIGKNK